MKLLPHQIEDAAFLAARRFAGCFNDMGSGKTLTALEAVKLVGAVHGVTVIIAPPIALPMWKAEAERHLGTKAQILKRGTTVIEGDANVLICSYDIARVRVEHLKAQRPNVLICDESHALKSTSAKRTQAILGKNGLCESAKYSWMLTGTPITRWADDMFPFLCRAGNGLLAKDIGGISKEKFELKYCVRQAQRVKTRWGMKTVFRVVGSRNLDDLNELIFGNGMAVRRQIEEVHAAMPPITHSNLVVSLTSSAEYKEANKVVAGLSMTKIQQQIAAGGENLATLRRLLGVAKVSATAEIIKERVADGLGPILVGAWHHDVIGALREELGCDDIKVRILTGKDPAQRKQAVVEQFNGGEIDVLIGQIGAMGVSLNLQKLGHRIVMIEQDWSPAVMAQFEARLWRMGQERHVHVDTIMSDNKLDKAVSNMLARKAAAHKKVLADV